MDDERAAQAAQLMGIAGVAEAFHPPVANNFVHLLIPRDRDPDRAVRAIAEATAPLNRADESLLEACAVMLAEHPDAAAERALQRWRECIRRRVNLLGIRWATEIAATLDARAVGMPSLSERLGHEHPEVLAAFRAIPRAMHQLVRVNGYLRPEQIGPALERIAWDLREPGLRAAIDRVEVARLARGVDVQAIDHPTLIVYLHDETPGDDALASAIEHVARRFAEAGPGLRPRMQYAQPLTPNATLTQGYYLLKRYLQLVGLLDELYDPATGHALTRPTHGGISQVLSRLPLGPQ